MPRYTVAIPAEGQAAGLYLGSAILPSFTRPASAYQSRGQVYGCPGTANVPSPRPFQAPSRNPVAMAQGGTHYSDNAPDYFRPSVYFENDQVKEHAPVQFDSVNKDMCVPPIPAVRPQNVLYADPYRAHIGGANQIVQPQVVPVWLGRGNAVPGVSGGS